MQHTQSNILYHQFQEFEGDGDDRIKNEGEMIAMTMPSKTCVIITTFSHHCTCKPSLHPGFPEPTTTTMKHAHHQQRARTVCLSLCAEEKARI